MKKIGIYYRVSTDRQDYASQQEAVQSWLKALPEGKTPSVIKEFEDHGISGKTTNRPGFKALLDAAYRGDIDTIVVYRLDRFSRHATTAIRLILALDESNVGFISVTQPVLNLGLENPFRRTMLAAFAEIAEIERETTVARVMAGLEAAKKRGVVLGKPRQIRDETIEKVKSLRAEGRTLRDIAKELSLSLGSVHRALSPSTSSLKEDSK